MAVRVASQIAETPMPDAQLSSRPTNRSARSQSMAAAAVVDGSMVRGDRTSGIVTTSGSGFWSRCGATGRGKGPPDRSAIGHDAVPSGRAGGRDQNPWSPEAGAERGAADRLPLGGSIVICPDRNASGAYGGGSFST